MDNMGFPGGSDSKESSYSGFHPWTGEIPWRRAWQPTAVFLPGESRGQRSLRAAVQGVAESDTTKLSACSMEGLWWAGFHAVEVLLV